MDKRSEVNAVYNSIKACPHCNALGACIYYGLRAYMDTVGLDEFTHQLIMGILPSDIGHSYEMKLEILNRPNWFSNLLQHPLLLVKQGMLIVLDNKVLGYLGCNLWLLCRVRFLFLDTSYHIYFICNFSAKTSGFFLLSSGTIFRLSLLSTLEPFFLHFLLQMENNQIPHFLLLCPYIHICLTIALKM